MTTKTNHELGIAMYFINMRKHYGRNEAEGMMWLCAEDLFDEYLLWKEYPLTNNRQR